MTEKTSYRALKTQTDYLKLVCANMVNRFGDSIDSIAFSWMMYQITGSASLMALIIGLNYIPTVLFTSFAGALVDRLNKKKVMVWMDIGRGMIVLATALMLHFHILTPGALIALTMSNSILECLRSPAGSAVVPLLLERDLYTLGSGLSGTLSRATELIGLALAGGIVALLGVTGALMIDMGTFFISALILSFLKVQEPEHTGKPDFAGVLNGFKEGLSFAKGSKVLLTLGYLGMLINFCSTPINVFATAYVVDDLQGGAEMLSFLQISLVVGMAVGSFITPKMNRISNRMLIIGSGIFVALVQGSLYFIPMLQIPHRYIVLLGSMVVMGVAIGVMNVVFSASFMRIIPAEKMGVLSGMASSVLTLAMPISSFLCSAVTGIVSVPGALLISGIASAVLFLMMLPIRALREV